MKKILCIVGKMDAGGAETFLMKIFRNINKDEYEMDFCVADENKGFYDDEIIEQGGLIFHCVPKSKNVIKSFFTIKKIVKNNKFKNVLRISDHSLGGLDLLAAKLGGAKNLIFRSSNTQTGGGKINSLLHKMFMPLAMLVPTIKIAPSTEAGTFMFGKNATRNNKVYILNNGLDLAKYRFNNEIRLKYRKELDIENKFVIGHIGRFNSQKNHDMLIDIFANIKQYNSNVVLLLIGKGELENQIKNKVKKYNLESNVKFLGVRDDIPCLLSAMDCFVFPSLFEGMPNTVIEAQASGLPCIISDSITKEAKILDTMDYLNLSDDLDEWSKCILKYLNYDLNNRVVSFKELKNKGFDIIDVVEKFKEFIK